ncbi:multidrug ABC transporter permease [Sporosarcina globispora]|uniref:Multidrug ABC transporter permease n=1 Tax=Sporosarcina globispora TaxID=1459 RepID=A0A0M0GLL7_SPOGL|nr:multidrug ABC transporter permease [Sporosarcina globispora]
MLDESNHKVNFVGLIKNRPFILLWLSSTASFLSLSTYLFAEQWYIITVLNKEASLGIVMMATMIPRVLFMIIGGVLADRFKKSQIMFISSLIRFLIVLIMIFFLSMSWLELWTLVGFALMFGILDAFFSPANTSLLPILVPKEGLIRANSLIQSSNQIAMVSGPMIGGLILTKGSFIHLFLSVALLLFMSFFFSLFIKEKEDIKHINKSAFSDLKEGITYVRSMQSLKGVLMILIIINFLFFGPLLMGIPLIVDKVIQGSALDMSFLQSSYQVGMLTGALIIGVLTIKKKRGLSILLMISTLGVLLTFLGQIEKIWHGVLLLILMGSLSSFINVMLVTSIQEKSQKDKIGRVMSLVSAFTNGLVPLSYAFVSIALVFNFGISNIMITCGIGITIISCIFILKSKVMKEEI